MIRLSILTMAALPGITFADGNPERGEALALRWCTACHVVSENEPGGDAGPAFTALMRNDTRSEFDLREWLFQPHPPMPDLNLTAEEIDDLIAYIRTVQN